MREKILKWKKEEVTIEQNLLECECGGIMRYVGRMDCIHEDFRSNLLQCEKCMRIELADFLPPNMLDEFEKNGWKKV